jgi:ABC-2 type transport system permease protein
MRAVWIIFNKELRAYFGSPVAYVILTGFTLLAGWLFYLRLQYFISITNMIQGYMVGGEVVREWTLTQDLMVPLYKSLSFLLIIMVPAITMRLFAEEKKLKTEELLFTSPIYTSQLLLGKYLAAACLLCVLLIPVGIYPLIIYKFGTSADMGPILSGYAGLFLLGLSLAAMGIFASSLTENQIVAFIFCAVLEMLFFTIGLAAGTVGKIVLFSISIDLDKALFSLSLLERFDSFIFGFVRITDFLYFISLIVFFLFLTRYSAESSRM